MLTNEIKKAFEESNNVYIALLKGLMLPLAKAGVATGTVEEAKKTFEERLKDNNIEYIIVKVVKSSL